jgi:hypothetical protein
VRTKRGANKKGRLIRLFGGLLILIASVFIARLNFTSAVDLAELNPDDWDLELVFFDSTVNKGKDPLTNVNWTINGEDLAYNATETRTITLQVNYKNAHVDRTYGPGELQIKVPNPFTSAKRSAAQLSMQIAVGANNASQTAYDWNYNYNSYDSSEWVFTNNTPVEELANVEGSIQVVYYLTSSSETREKYNDSCVHTTETTGMKAIMNNVVESNTAETHFTRTYLHPWRRATYYIKKTATKIPSLDNLGDGAGDYIWVRYRFESKGNENYYLSLDRYDYNDFIGLKNYQIRDKFPTGLRIQDSYGNAIPQDENGYVDIMKGTTYSSSGYQTWKEIYVGYPKSVYNETAGNLEITNKVELRGTYSDRTDEEELATATIDLNLANFEFSYPSGNQVGISKSYTGNVNYSNYNLPYYYQDIVRNGSTGIFRNAVSANYLGQAYDIHIGDDLVYYLDGNGNLQRMSDDDYYFSYLNIPQFKNMNGVTVDYSKYHPTVYVRYKGSTEYVKYTDAVLGQTINFTEAQHVQGWYVEIKDLTESIGSGTYFYTRITLKSQNLSQNGTLYNFDYVKYIVNGVVQNYWSLDNYTNQLTKEVVASYDLETYGHYLHRSWAQATWEYHDIGDISHSHYVYKNYNNANPPYDPSDESFKDYYYMYAQVTDSNYRAFTDMELNREQMEEKDWRHNLTLYDLLPLGMELNGTQEDIIDSAGIRNCGTSLYGKDGNKLFDNKADCQSYYKTHTTVTITKNWHNTGRTHVKIRIDFSANPFTVLNGANSYTVTLVSYHIPYKVSYDSYVENGRTYKNYGFLDTTDYSYQYALDNGTACGDADAADINDNGDVTDYVSYSASTINLLSATSTRQDLQTSVLTEHSGKYETDLVQSGFSEDYSYKLRVRTGANKVTNMIVYNHLEESYGDNNYWQGGFDGIDTSYAETRLDYYDNPIKIKVFWSPNPKAGSLADDNSWQEYDEATVDKTKVRSLAFQFLDQNGEPATMAQQFYSYVLVKMKAPSDENIHVLAYNSSESEWNAIDNLTGQLIHNITGIESNVVTVFLSEKYDLSVKKIWSDYNNYYQIRPDTITFNLYKDDEIVDTKTLNVSEGETEVRFTNLITTDQDHYRVEEAGVAEYTSSFTQDGQSLAYTFTNTINRDEPTFTLSVKKEWSDYDDYYKLRPDTIKFNLYKGDEIVATKELNIKNGETEAKFEGLKALEQDRYRVEEEKVAEYTSRSTIDEQSQTYTFVNTVNRDAPQPAPEPEPEPEPQPQPEPENANTFDGGVKVFFIIGGSLASLTVLMGIAVKRNLRRS